MKKIKIKIECEDAKEQKRIFDTLMTFLKIDGKIKSNKKNKSKNKYSSKWGKMIS